MKDAIRHNAPLRLHWWRAVPNFGDAINPLVVGHVAGREVAHTGPKKAELFAIGSMLQVVRRNFREPREGARLTVWGTGLLHPVNSLDFLENIDVALVRGPITAALLGLETDEFGDAGLLVNEVIQTKEERADKIGILPHHSIADDEELAALAASDPAYTLIDPRGAAEDVCRKIASCAHVFASSLHGLIVADAYGVANTWMDPRGQSRLKYHDYAASVGRSDMRAPISIDAVSKAPKPNGALSYAPFIDACRAALHASFPKHLKGGTT